MRNQSGNKTINVKYKHRGNRFNLSQHLAKRQEEENRGGYYTVYMRLDGIVIPYTVFALSDYHAARVVREETGYMAAQSDIEGPYLAL